jgi:hypothetical protein
MAAVNPLFQHVKDDDLYEIIKDLLSDPNRNDKDGEGKTPLHYVRSVDVAKALLHPTGRLTYPIDINAIGKNGYSPLMSAIHQGQNEVALYLIDEGVDVNVVGTDGVTARSMIYAGPVRERLDQMGAKLGKQKKEWLKFLGFNSDGSDNSAEGPEAKGGRRTRNSRKSRTRKSRGRNSRTRKSRGRKSRGRSL